MGLTSALLLISCFAASVHGHGYLMDPPGRASAWRYGFDTPVDYNDMEGFCGGFNYQYQEMGGKCGLCGDAWDADPRPHEVGGIYATGTLVRNYTQGQIIPVTANVTANHLGHFEYKICANNNITVEATQECLDLTPLYAVGHEEWFLYIGDAVGSISHELQLPADLQCSQCVIQWRYVASNTWGICDNGTEATGCGAQEEFRGCADVAILPPLQEWEESVDILAEPEEQVLNAANAEEKTKEVIIKPSTDEKQMEEEETVQVLNAANAEVKTIEVNVNTATDEEQTEEEETVQVLNPANAEVKTKKVNVNTATDEEQTEKEETVQVPHEPASKLKEMPNAMKLDDHDAEEKDKKKSKRDKKAEKESDDESDDESEDD